MTGYILAAYMFAGVVVNAFCVAYYIVHEVDEGDAPPLVLFCIVASLLWPIFTAYAFYATWIRKP